MDSLTQILLGAGVSCAMLGGKSKDMKVPFILGGVVGTLPDLDVFISHGDPLYDFIYHRGWTHSILAHLLIAPILAYVLSFMKAFKEISYFYLAFTLCLILSTHAILDSITVYGTQLFWPFVEQSPVSIGSLFIIDPLYTLPFLFLLILCRQKNKASYAKLGLILSSFYIFLSLTAQSYVAKHAVYSLKDQEIAYQDYKVTATPFNTLLWRVMVRDETHYHIGYMSVFDENKNIKFKSYEHGQNIGEALTHFEERIAWFTNGFYKVDALDSGDMVLTDIRMGVEDAYVFAFIAVDGEKTLRLPSNRDRSRISQILKRIFNEDIEL